VASELETFGRTRGTVGRPCQIEEGTCDVALTVKEVAEIVAAECEALEDFENHGITRATVCQHLVTPRRHSVFVTPAVGVRDLWIVLREKLGAAAEGYVVVFDELENRFGLCYDDGKSHQIEFIGFYGSLHSTLVGM
jgi:hypothetical protein